MNEYFTVQEADKFKFYMIPKMLMDEKFKKLSFGAKFLYGLLLDTNSLSIKNGWIDELGRVYIYYSRERAMEKLCISDKTATNFFRELTKYCLIEEKKQGLGKPNIIYVKKFYESIENSKNRKIYGSGTGNFTVQGPEIFRPNNTNINNTDINNTTTGEISKNDNISTNQFVETKKESPKTDVVPADIIPVIESKVDGKVELKTFKGIIKGGITLEDINKYLDNWYLFEYKTKDNPMGFFMHCLKNRVPIPVKRQGKYSSNEPPQSRNFEQRKYDDDEYDLMYDNDRL